MPSERGLGKAGGVDITSSRVGPRGLREDEKRKDARSG